MRPQDAQKVGKFQQFQSTHPKRDETVKALERSVALQYFNPLIPSGMRQKNSIDKIRGQAFQSTHPKRDETEKCRYNGTDKKFQSTHPKRDETPVHTIAPCFHLVYISIHSSQAG